MPTLDEIRKDHNVIYAVLLYPILNIVQWWHPPALGNVLDQELIEQHYEWKEDFIDPDIDVDPVPEPRRSFLPGFLSGKLEDTELKDRGFQRYKCVHVL